MAFTCTLAVRRFLSRLSRWESLCFSALVVVATGGCLPSPAQATAPDEAIAVLNQQRAAYGIPPVTLDQSLLKPECNLGNHEIASPSTRWSSSESPWDGAPFHEETLFSPAAVAAAYGEYDHFGDSNGTWSCMWFRRSTATSGFYWAAEASGPNAVPPALYAYESPNSPAETLGLSDPTGPNLIVYASNLASHPGATSVSVVDSVGQPVPARLAYDQPESAIVVIEKPTSSYSRFDVTVHWQGTAERLGPSGWETGGDEVQRFSFATGLSPLSERPSLRLSKGGRKKKRALVRIDADPLLVGQQIEMAVATLQRRCGKQRKPPRPGCGWGTSHRRLRKLVLPQERVDVLVPGPSARRKVRIRVWSKAFISSAGRVQAANAKLELAFRSRRG